MLLTMSIIFLIIGLGIMALFIAGGNFWEDGGCFSIGCAMFLVGLIFTLIIIFVIWKFCKGGTLF